MPCLEISMPRQSSRIKQKLADKLTKAFENHANYDVAAFGIRFYEYDIGETVNGGVVWDGKTDKPYIHFVLHIPARTLAEKRNLILGFSLEFTDCLGKPDWTPVIYINEYADDCIGYDGLTVIDHKNR